MNCATWTRAILIGVALTAGCAEAVRAQIVTTTPSIPEAKAISPGGVDLRTGEYVSESGDLSIGADEAGGLQFVRVPRRFKVFTSNWHFRVWKRPNPNGGSYYQIENRAIAKTFASTNNVIFLEVSLALDGLSSLQLLGSGSSKYFLYTAPDGTTTRFSSSADGANSWAEEIKRPDGLTYSFAYDNGGPSGEQTRLRRVQSNTGYQLILEYHASPNHEKILRVCALNAAATTPPAAQVCPGGARSVSYTYSGVRLASFTDAAGAVSTITHNYLNATTPFWETFYKPGIAQAWLTNYYGLDQSFGVQLHVYQQSFAGGRTLTIGKALVKHLRNSGACNVTGSRIPSC